MPGKLALVDSNKCNPEKYRDGICLAALACERKLIEQESPYRIPMTNPSLCRVCGDCLRACPLNAIRIIRG